MSLKYINNKTSESVLTIKSIATPIPIPTMNKNMIEIIVILD